MQMPDIRFFFFFCFVEEGEIPRFCSARRIQSRSSIVRNTRLFFTSSAIIMPLVRPYGWIKNNNNKEWTKIAGKRNRVRNTVKAPPPHSLKAVCDANVLGN